MTIVLFYGSFVLLLSYLLQSVKGTARITAKFDNHVPVGNLTFFKPNQSITLFCFTDNPAVNWTYPHHAGAGGPVTASHGVSGTTMTLNPIKASDGGKYVCNDGATPDSFYLNVLDSQSLVPQNVTTDGTQGHVTLTCEQRFERPFPVIWRYPGVNGTVLNDVPATSHTYLVKPEESWKLVITNEGYYRHPEKTGAYFCELNQTALPDTVIGQLVTYQCK